MIVFKCYCLFSHFRMLLILLTNNDVFNFVLLLLNTIFKVAIGLVEKQKKVIDYIDNLFIVV